MTIALRSSAQTDEATSAWRQGDFVVGSDLQFAHLADLSIPITSGSNQLARALAMEGECGKDQIGVIFCKSPGFVVLTQTCDIVRSCSHRPYVEVAPFVELLPKEVENIRRLKRPTFVYVPGAARLGFVADLTRVMTIEKSLLVSWQRNTGCSSDEEVRDFAAALARKSARFAFPNDFVAACEQMKNRWIKRHGKDQSEGRHLEALREIRVRAAPSWDSAAVKLTFWFIRVQEPEAFTPKWSDWIGQWMALFDGSKRFQIEATIPCKLEDMTARDYVESDRLDLDQLSTSS